MSDEIKEAAVAPVTDKSDVVGLSSLGSSTKRDFANNKDPRPEWLETFENRKRERDYLVPFVQLDTTFRSLCPKTGQPDSAKIEIIYVPGLKMVESKSLKEYLQSFCNSGEFHEDVINRIAEDLATLMDPKYIRVFGDFVPRGDLAIKPLVSITKSGLTDAEYRTIDRLVDMWDAKNR